MARNGSGTYSVVNTFVAGNTITAAGHNQNWSDLATEITNSVAADGQTAMTAPLKAANGAVGAPSYTFNSDTDSGFYRIGANNIGISVGGTKIVDIASTGATVVGDVAATTATLSGLLSGSTATLTGLLTLSSTAHMLPPRGTTAQRSGTTTGSTRFNTDTADLEFYNGSTWVSVTSLTAAQTGFALRNGSLVCSVGSSALTIAIKGVDGNDPSATNPVYAVIRNATVANGDYSLITITAATSLVISSGSTVGATNSVAFRLWIVGFNDGGTFRLGAINCVSGTNIYPLAPWSIASSTAEGGAGAADSAHVIYTGTAVTSKPYQILGYATYESGLATAGTYNVVPTRVQLFGYGVPLPGAMVQRARSASGAVQTGTTLVANDDTLPTSSHGTQFFTQAITPSSAANVLAIEHQGFYTEASTNSNITALLLQDSTANSMAAATGEMSSGGANYCAVYLSYFMLAGTSSSTTFKIRAGAATAGTVTLNGFSSARKLGGVMNSYLDVCEYMA